MTDVRDEISGETGRHQWNKEPRLKGATQSEEGEDIRQDLRENNRAGDREVKSLVFCQDTENACQNFVEEPALSETARTNCTRLKTMDVGVLPIL
jgi:hypothetical protein